MQARGSVALLFGCPSSTVEEHFGWKSLVGAQEKMCLATSDTRSSKCSDVAITMMLPQGRAVLPETLDRVIQSFEVAIGFEERSTDRLPIGDHGFE